MTPPPGGPSQPTTDLETLDPMSASRRYPRPALDTRSLGGANLPTTEELNTFVRRLGTKGWWTLPRTLGVVGIVAAFVFGPLGLVLGIVGHYKAKQREESVRLPKIAWVLSLVLPVFGLAMNACARSLFTVSGFY